MYIYIYIYPPSTRVNPHIVFESKIGCSLLGIDSNSFNDLSAIDREQARPTRTFVPKLSVFQATSLFVHCSIHSQLY